MQITSARRLPSAPKAREIGAFDSQVVRARDTLRRLLARVARAIAEEIAAQRAQWELESLSERELRDIGLTPADVGRAPRDTLLAALRLYTWR